MPELPEVESLAAYLRATATGLRVARVELAAISALKTFDPPVTALVGARIIGPSPEAVMHAGGDQAHLRVELSYAA